MKLLQNHLIDYQVLGKACKYYEGHAFKQTEVPWIVNRIYMEFTCPLPGVGYAIPAGSSGHDYLVCSAEQGFIRQALLGEGLKNNQPYYAVSPCFRDEERDDTHSTWFMKQELFVLGNKVRADYWAQTFCALAKTFFESLGVKNLEFVQTEIGWDIMQGDLELGSYGTRHIMGGEYCAYGTGVALPRISLAMERSKKVKKAKA